MDFLDTLQTSLTPYTTLKLYAGVGFKPGVGSSTYENDITLTTGSSLTGVPTGFITADTGHLYQIKILKTSFSSFSGFDIEFKIGNYNKKLSPNYVIPPGELADNSAYNLTDQIEIYGLESITSDDKGHTLTFAGSKFGSDPTITFNKPSTELTHGDTWIFPDYGVKDVSRYLVSSNQFSFQGGAITDQFTYLGNTIQIELLKSINGDRLFDPLYDSNIFTIQNWNQMGYRAKFELTTGFIEGGEEIAFVGFVENITEDRDTIKIDLGDGIYKSKETYAHNIGILEKDRDLRQVGEILSSNIASEVKRAKIESLTYTAAFNEKKFETYFKPLVKGFNGQKLTIRPNDKLDSSDTENYDAKIVKSLNFTGKLNSDQAIVDYNNGAVTFEVPPIKVSEKGKEGGIFFTFKHAYKWKHPTFLAKKLFQQLGYTIDENNFDSDTIESDVGRVFTRNGRVLTNTGEREKEINRSICYVENDPVTTNQNGGTAGDSFYFAIGRHIVQHNVKTNDEKIIYEATQNRVIYKILTSTTGSGNSTVVNLVWFEGDDNFNTTAGTNLVGADGQSNSQVNIHRKILTTSMGDEDFTILLGDSTVVFSTPNNTSLIYEQIKHKGSSSTAQKYDNTVGFNYNYTLIGSPGNKDYSNKAYLVGNNLYFIFHAKNYLTRDLSRASFQETGGDALTTGWYMNLDDKQYLLKIDISSTITHPTIDTTHSTGGFKLTGDNQIKINLVAGHGVSDGDTLILSQTNNVNQLDGVWVVPSGGVSSNEVTLNCVVGWINSDINPLTTDDFYNKKLKPKINGGIEKLLVDGSATADTTIGITSSVSIFNLSSYSKVDDISFEREFFGLDGDTKFNKDLEENTSWIDAWGFIPNSRTDLFVDEDTESIYLVSVTGNGGQASDSYNLSDQTSSHKIRVRKYSDSLAVVWTKETTFEEVYSKFFVEGNYRHKLHHQTGNKDDDTGLHSYMSQYIPYDLWGICKTDNLITICTHWCNRYSHEVTVLDDFKSIILYRLDDDSDGDGVWVHKADSTNLHSRLNSDKPEEKNNNSSNPMFFVQRNLVQGTDDEETYDSVVNFPQYQGESGKENFEKDSYGLELVKANNVLTKDTMSMEVRGRGEITMLPRSPVVWTDENGDKSIVYLGGNFGPYSTNSKIASLRNDKPYKFRILGFNDDVSYRSENYNYLKGLTPYPNYKTENSHGRLIKFSALREWDQEIEDYVTNSSDQEIKGIEWDYLGYPVVNSFDDIYKDFSSEIVLDKNNNLHFIASRSVRTTTNRNHKHIRKSKKFTNTNPAPAWLKTLVAIIPIPFPQKVLFQLATEVSGDWEKDSQPVHHNSKNPANPFGGMVLYYRIVGDMATSDQIDEFLLDNVDNFMWVQYSDKLSTKLPLANFNDTYIYNVLHNLSLIMNYEFGIENNQPFFRKKNISTPLTEDLSAGVSTGSIPPSLVDCFTINKLHLVDNELIQRDGNNFRRGLFGSTDVDHAEETKVYKLSLLAFEENIVDIKNYSVDYDYIYDEVTGSFSYFSHSLNRNISFNISEKAEYQELFNRNLDLSIPYLEDKNWANIIIARHLSLLAVKNSILEMSVKYSPFLKSGQTVAVKDIDFNIDYEPFSVLSVSHNLSSFTSNMKLRSIRQPLLTISGTGIS